MNEIESLLFLTHVPFLGSIKIRFLLKHFGSAVAAAQINPDSLIDLPGFGPRSIHEWKETIKCGQWKKTLDQSFQEGIQVLSYQDPLYPKSLLNIVDFPLVLYVKGSLSNCDQSLAVIGTRQASIYGLENAKKISGELARAGFTIVSGLARGIDTAAHEAACSNGKTIAVLGSGLNQIYPKENLSLAKKIIEKGALISEFPYDTPPDKQHFPQRNRIVSGMTRATILIEAPRKSGAMLTTDLALQQGKKIFALPGRVDQENFEGNHYLIKNQYAELIEKSQDVIIYFNDLFPAITLPSLPRHSVFLEKEEEDFIKLLPAHELSIEDIVTKTAWPMARINVVLITLVLKKIIKEYPGKIYKKI